MTLERPRGLAAAPPPAHAWDRAPAEWPHAHLLQSSTAGGPSRRRWAGGVHRLRVDAGAGRTLPVTALSAPVIPGAPPRLDVPRGPACAPGDASAWAAAVAALEALADRLGAVSVTVEPSAAAGDAAEIAGRLGTAWAVVDAVQPAHTAIVDLAGGVGAVLARMRPKGRYNVRLAERRGVTGRHPGPAPRRRPPVPALRRDRAPPGNRPPQRLPPPPGARRAPRLEHPAR